MSSFIVDHEPVEVQDGDSVLLAMLRAGRHPTGGGCLCLAGDCPHCLATVDGVSYVRTCQVKARAGLVVECSHRGGNTPPLLSPNDDCGPGSDDCGPGSRVHHPSCSPSASARHLHCDVVVIGQGSAGRQAVAELRELEPKTLIVALDASRGGGVSRDSTPKDSAPKHSASRDGARRGGPPRDSREPEEVIGIYAGPLVVARAGKEILYVHPRREIVVATGASEIQPVAPGNHLAGLVTARAATALESAGVDLGRLVAVTAPKGRAPGGSPRDDDLGATAPGERVVREKVEGEIVRFEGTERVEAVVLRVEDGAGDKIERRIECDTVSLELGFQPRDALFRMARDLPVRLVGDAACESDVPPCPLEGVVCPCSGVTVEDLDSVWERGFHELELVKRATLAGTGSCQGAVCIPYLRSFLLDRGQELQPPFTARPVTRQLTIGEVAAGAYLRATPRTALHDEHVRLGARMERSSGWWRPWDYGDREAEYWAVRDGVSLCDVSTLGKLLVAGPDAELLLEHLYPTRIATLEPGRAHYALLLDERGAVLDDGLVARESEERFLLTLTSGGASFAEMWIRDWADSLRGPKGDPLDVRILDQTASLGAINVTGPLAAELLARAGVSQLPRFAAHCEGTVAGVACRIFRLSFTGELSYELHPAAADSIALWRRLLELGRDLGIRPHGIATLLDLRLEKGHLVVGKDTGYDATPRRLGHEWAVQLAKSDFVGRQALLRTNKIPLDRQLVGLEMELPVPIEGAVIRYLAEHGEEDSGRYAGEVTSSFASPRLGKAVMLGWLLLRNGELPETVEINGREARRVPTPFYDPSNERSRAKVDVRFSSEATSATELGAKAAEQLATTPRSRFRLVEAVRVVARPEAFDGVAVAKDLLSFRFAPDEALFLRSDLSTQVPRPEVDDAYALVVRETGFAGAWLDFEEARHVLERTCSWRLPERRPAFAQGAVADLPVKLYFEQDRVLFLVPAPLAHELEERLAG